MDTLKLVEPGVHAFPFLLLAVVLVVTTVFILRVLIKTLYCSFPSRHNDDSPLDI